MKNPWEEIELTIYESHMSLELVKQLQTLNTMMKEQFYQYPSKKIMILGIAGGNGLEHIDPQMTESVIGVDINSDYLSKCVDRYPQLNGVLHILCVDLTKEDQVLPPADLLVADLLIEYIGYACFQSIIHRVKPAYITCVIQINEEDHFVSESPYLHAFKQLDTIHNEITRKSLIKAMKDINYDSILNMEEPLPNGKKLLRLDFKRIEMTEGAAPIV